MQSLTELNSHSRFIFESPDSRPAGIVFDRLLSIKQDQLIKAATSVTVTEAINIDEIINYSLADVKFKITINAPAGFTSSISWATIPAGLTLTTVGNVYTISGIKTAAEWNAIKNPRWIIPSNYASYPLWSLTCQIIYFDESLNQTLSVDYDVYDPDYYYVSEPQSTFSVMCDSSKRINPSLSLNSTFSMKIVFGIHMDAETNMTVSADRKKGLAAVLPSINTLMLTKVDDVLTVTYNLTSVSQAVEFDLFGVTSTRIYWGDGTFTDTTTSGRFTKTYGTIGNKRINVVGSYTGFFNRSKTLKRVLSFPSSGLTKLGGLGTDLLEIPSQLPSSVRDLSQCFARTVFTETIDIADPHFNLSTISSWDISNVTNISGIFSGNRLFNTSLNSWNTANVTDMSSAFYDSVYNQPLNNWNTQNVTTMFRMFSGTGTGRNTPFNQYIGNWNVSNVTDMQEMFAISSFNQNINTWDVSKVTTFFGMFSGNRSYNQPMNNWNIINATILSYMFESTIFNQPIGSWNTQNVRFMNHMFYGSSSSKTPFNQPIGSWNTSNVRSSGYMFAWSVFNQPIGSWNTSNFANPDLGSQQYLAMRGMFLNNSDFDQNISGWCMRYQTTKPTDFDTGTSANWLTSEKPVWGTCP